MNELTDAELLENSGGVEWLGHLWLHLLLEPTAMGDAELHTPDLAWGFMGGFSYDGGMTDLPYTPGLA